GFHGGSQYLLYTFLRIRDVRAVYVPSRSIGEYGGEIDNWMWPRHTGDFSFLRAYVSPDGRAADFSKDNVPFRPKRYLKVAKDGLRDGEFSIIIGFPGRTNRYLTSHGLRWYESFEYPERIRLYKRITELLEAQAAEDPAAAVKVAGQLKGFYNSRKNNEGMVEGFRKLRLVQRQREREARLAEKWKGGPEPAQKYGTLLSDFEALYEERAGYGMKDLLLSFLFDKDRLLGQAMQIYQWSLERQKPDLARDPDFMDRRKPDIERSIRVFQTQLHLESDRGILELLLRELLDLPDGQRMRTLDDVFGGKHVFEGKRGEELDRTIAGFLDALYANTSLYERDERFRLFKTPYGRLRKERDSFLALAARLYPEYRETLDRETSRNGALSVLVPKWIEAATVGSTAPVYADANGTMRVNFGKVQGISVRDAVYHKPFTTLHGVVEKHTGEDPFNCPERLLELAAAHEYGDYSDPALGDVPVNLLTTHDSTGGNSGSPILNAKGEVAGCLFDGTYEGMTGDFDYDDSLNRSIHVDIRYVLFIADLVDGAQNVLEELGVK
ncbi:MAG: S46 family peptidase, partial [Candidatus Eisenbacteria bacterium]